MKLVRDPPWINGPNDGEPDEEDDPDDLIEPDDWDEEDELYNEALDKYEAEQER